MTASTLVSFAYLRRLELRALEARRTCSSCGCWIAPPASSCTSCAAATLDPDPDRKDGAP